ncbi:MAG: ABC transporter permease subunit [Burkholderiaceae bacterium]
MSHLLLEQQAGGLQVFLDAFTWLPFLLQGFGLNLLISAVAMVLGSVFGLGVARLRMSDRSVLQRGGRVLTELTRNVPTFVCLYYLAFMLPSEFSVPGIPGLVSIPGWFKASVALSIAVTGFCADNLGPALQSWRSGDHGRALLFLPSWAAYALIIVMASSTASVIGVPELLSRCNTVIGATGSSAMMLPMYLMACVIFLLACWPLIRLMDRIKRRMMDRLRRPGPAALARING